MPGRYALSALIIALLLAWPIHGSKAQTSASSSGAQARPMVMGTGGVTGFYFPVGGALCRVVNAVKARTGMRCLVESTAGSLQNLNGLRTGEYDLAIVQSGWAHQAVKGTGAFAVEGAGRDLRALMVLHGEPLTLLVRKDSGIASVPDLKRRKVNLGRKGSAQRQLIEALFEAQGWGAADFPQAVEIEADDQLDALCAGKIEMAAYVIAHPINVIEEAMSRCNARLLDIDAKTVIKLAASQPFLAPLSIPAGLYPGQPKVVQTFGMRAILAATTRMSNEDAAAVVTSVIDNFDRFKHLHPTLELLGTDGLSQSEPVMPLHDGARRVFKDRKLLNR